jgi:SAM-dependent methyltransferase
MSQTPGSEENERSEKKEVVKAELTAALAALGEEFPWRRWASAWDASQNAEVPFRRQRFELIAELLNFESSRQVRVLELGIGTGSLSSVVLRRYPNARLVGIDSNPFLVALGRKTLTDLGDRIQILEADLMDENIWNELTVPFDGVVSSTTIHWFSMTRLADLFKKLAGAVRPGGKLLITDPVSSVDPSVQAINLAARDRYVGAHTMSDQTPWRQFWERAGRAIGFDFSSYFKASYDLEQMGPEEGYSFDDLGKLLTETGFTNPEIYWKYYGETIFGAIAKGEC